MHTARQVVSLVLASAALILVGSNAAALIVFRGGDFLAALDQQTREAIDRFPTVRFRTLASHQRTAYSIQLTRQRFLPQVIQ